jgi:hypothetical protein
VLPFVSVHQVHDGKVALWKNYRDLGALARYASPSCLDALSGTDTSWVFDATGLI